MDETIIHPALRFIFRFYTFAARSVENVVDGAIVKSSFPLTAASAWTARRDESIDRAVLQPVLQAFFRIYCGTLGAIDAVAELFIVKSRFHLKKFAGNMDKFDRILLAALGKRLFGAINITGEISFKYCLKIAHYILREGKGYGRLAFFFFIKTDYDTKGERFYYYFNILNFDFGIILIFLVLVILLYIGIFVV